MALSQFSADHSQEGGNRMWAWDVAEALMDNSRWGRVTQGGGRTQRLTCSTHSRQEEGTPVCGWNWDKFTIHKQILHNCWIPGLWRTSALLSSTPSERRKQRPIVTGQLQCRGPRQEQNRGPWIPGFSPDHNDRKLFKKKKKKSLFCFLLYLHAHYFLLYNCI